MTCFKFRNLSVITVALAVSAMLATTADARRSGSFGSRGARTHSAPPPTATAPQPVAPVQRSMTPNQSQAQTSASSAQRAAPSANRFGGMAKGLIGGLIAGGLIAALMGGGFGALAGSGFMMALLQAAMLGGLVWFVIRLFRRRSTPAVAYGAGSSPFTAAPFMGGPLGGSSVPSPARLHAFAAAPQQNISIEQSDKEMFERLLMEVQEAFGREDYAALRERTTPEVMSYLAEELGQNATNGQRNDVSGTRLMEAEVAEAWREGGTDYATIAMRYESIDVMRDRNNGALVSGDANEPTQATELWTFVRHAREQWLLSAIQAA